MARNVLISFLGTSAYKEAHYQLKDECSENVTFIQEALLRLLFPKPSDNDQFFIFLTEEAKTKNWQDNGHEDRVTKEVIQKDGLHLRLKASGHLENTQTVDIPSGKSTGELWEIFEAVFQQIQEGDQVHLDITHSFRSIPMLSMTLLNYARALKNIDLKGIYYGAWEARNTDSNIAPVFDLTPLDKIQRWSSAVNQFVKYGQVEELNAVLKETYTPRLAKYKGKDEQAIRLRQLDKETSRMTGLFTTNRGKSIENRQLFENYINLLQEKSAEEEWDHFMDPLRNKIIQKVQPFASNDSEPNWLLGVKWCIDHNLIQQGITQLQEGIVTYIIDEFEDSQLNPTKVNDRDFVKKALNLGHARKNPEHKHSNSDWDKFPCDPGEKLISLPMVQKLAGKFYSFSEIRNRINHAGMSENDKNSFKDFKRELESFYTCVKNMVVTSPLLINISNHPSEQWSDIQHQKALEIAQKIIDIAFPAVPPQADEEQIEEMVEETVAKILSHNPSHVHIMGEFTFTYRMVRELKAHSITCIASTSRRKVREIPDGSKNVVFDFSSFRKY